MKSSTERIPDAPTRVGVQEIWTHRSSRTAVSGPGGLWSTGVKFLLGRANGKSLGTIGSMSS